MQDGTVIHQRARLAEASLTRIGQQTSKKSALAGRRASGDRPKRTAAISGRCPDRTLCGRSSYEMFDGRSFMWSSRLAQVRTESRSAVCGDSHMAEI